MTKNNQGVAFQVLYLIVVGLLIPLAFVWYSTDVAWQFIKRWKGE